jgi:hypothetical protein
VWIVIAVDALTTPVVGMGLLEFDWGTHVEV